VSINQLRSLASSGFEGENRYPNAASAKMAALQCTAVGPCQRAVALMLSLLAESVVAQLI